jgi:hypothetical protein
MNKGLWDDFILIKFGSQLEKERFLKENNIKMGIIRRPTRQWDRTPPFRGDIF